MYFIEKLEKINLNGAVINTSQKICLNMSDTRELNEARNKINSVNQVEWTKIRKATNVYESPYFLDNINNKKIISRAFYKLWEILCEFKVSSRGDTFHICDAPGGFIQAMMSYSKDSNTTPKTFFTISLENSKNQDIPRYNKNLLLNKNVVVINSLNNNDITNPRTIIDVLRRMRMNDNLNVITCDGGVAENGDYNNKEINHVKLIISQILIGLSLLKNNGTFIIKIFDIYTFDTVQIILLLNCCFRETFIVKPSTSRPTNSEKYIVCKNFTRESFCCKIKNILFSFICSDNISGFSLFGYSNIPRNFLQQIKNFNDVFTKFQIKSIYKNINIINQHEISKKKIIEEYTDKKRIFCRNWLIKYNVVL